jgi:hypothetical protein
VAVDVVRSFVWLCRVGPFPAQVKKEMERAAMQEQVKGVARVRRVCEGGDPAVRLCACYSGQWCLILCVITKRMCQVQKVLSGIFAVGSSTRKTRAGGAGEADVEEACV